MYFADQYTVIRSAVFDIEGRESPSGRSADSVVGLFGDRKSVWSPEKLCPDRRLSRVAAVTENCRPSYWQVEIKD
jgi:hypothetical protein